MKVLIPLALILLGAHVGQAQNFKGNQKDIDQILENTRKFSAYVMASDYDGIASSYTKEAKIFPNNALILEGNDIIQYWTLPEGGHIPYHKITQSEITVEKDTAYDYGYYQGQTKHKDGSLSNWKGKYVIVWKKIEGEWKMYLDIWNNVKEKRS
nr:DUF4440 domain-containing protein [uncultured Allomuricauda sp.]